MPQRRPVKVVVVEADDEALQSVLQEPRPDLLPVPVAARQQEQRMARGGREAANWAAPNRGATYRLEENIVD